MQGFSSNRKSIVGVILGLLLFGVVAEVWAGPPLGHGRRYNLRHHKGHHGQGFAGDGICPQGRFTVQAPEDIHNQTNPLKPSREVLYSGESLFQLEVQPMACRYCRILTQFCILTLVVTLLTHNFIDTDRFSTKPAPMESPNRELSIGAGFLEN